METQGSVVAITGANRGIGRALVDAFLQAGARVVAHARTESSARAVADAVIGECEAVWGDVRDPELGARIAGAARDRFGRLDTLILNAAILGPMERLEDTPLAVFAEVMDVNVNAQVALFHGTRELLCEGGGGKIVWLTSGLGHFALPRYGAYCASKHAVEGVMKTVAVEHEEDGLLSAAVAPGMVQTEMLKSALLGADVSPYERPERVAQGFVRFVAELTPARSGERFSIDAWLP